MDLVNIDVRVRDEKAEEGTGGKLSNVNIVVWSTKVQEFYVKGRFVEVLIHL